MSPSTPSPPRRRLGWAARLLLLTLVVAVVVLALAWRDYRAFASAPLGSGPTASVLEVQRGDSLRRIVARLSAAGLTPEWRHPWWHALAIETEVIRRLQAGEYSLEPGITPRQLLAKLASGQVIQYQFTIVEGWTFAQLRQALASVEGLRQTLADHDGAMVMAALGAEGDHPEGWFLPETYAYTRGGSDLELLRRAHQAMRDALEEHWAKRSPEAVVGNPYHALILASIIEKETGQAGERRRIAGVFSRRLDIGMRLQTDPTVIYGLGSAFDGNLRRRDLDTDTPYNTYTRGGLPPTPIALPGRAALAAALDPAGGTELYFVSKGDGSHQFSTTYDEHRAAIRRYILGGRRAPARDSGSDGPGP